MPEVLPCPSAHAEERRTEAVFCRRRHLSSPGGVLRGHDQGAERRPCPLRGVGGLAVVLHGHVRVTFALDLIVDLSPAEARKAMDALTGLGFRPKVPVDAVEFADPATRARWIDEKGMTVFAFWHPKDPDMIVDVFVEEPIDFGALWERSVVARLESTDVRIASIPDLIDLKRRAGRPNDLADIEVLETTLEIQDEER